MQLFTAFFYKNHSFYDPQRAIQKFGYGLTFKYSAFKPIQTSVIYIVHHLNYLFMLKVSLFITFLLQNQIC
jgi:hypothetical protein